MTQLRRTPLYQAHVDLGARLVPFAGWEMPVRYGSIIDEHNAVRRHSGMFDVSHMGRFRIVGPDAAAWLDRVIAGNVGGLSDRRGLYSVMCNEDGGIVDDCIVYRLSPNAFLLVVNASNRDKDWQWIQSHRNDCNAALDDASGELAMIALAGPEAMVLLSRLTDGALASTRRFDVTEASVGGIPCLIARTGYTGEDGAELMPPADRAIDLWNLLLQHHVTPAGLGARDTLRLEAALCLYGNDIDDTTNPIEAGLGWTISKQPKDYVGRQAIEAARSQGPARKLVGIRVDGRDIPRAHSELRVDGRGVGELTSGTMSPTLGVGIGMGYIDRDHSAPGTAVEVAIRDRLAPATVVKLPFYSRV